MFCTRCGGALPGDTKFCAACGAAAGAGPAAGAASLGEARFRVSLQGVDDAVTRATGDYDSIDLPEPLDEEALRQLLERLQALPVEPQLAAGDFCPPHAVVEAGSETYQFHVEEGALVSAQTGASVSVEQALQLVTGALAKESLRPVRPYPRGMQPLRKSELAPTFWESLDAKDVDTGPGTPQSAEVVWKGPTWLLMSVGCIAMGATLLLITVAVLLGGVEKRDRGGVLLGLAMGAGLIGLGVALRAGGRGPLRYGVDWKTNTLWFVQDGRTAYQPHANCIRELATAVTRTGNRFGSANPVPGRKPREIWHLEVVYADGHASPTLAPAFASGGDARSVARAATRLLAAQR